MAFRSSSDFVDAAGWPLGAESQPGRLRLEVENADGPLAVAETGELVDDVRTSRARLVGAADAERERLGRDLHDSAQQRLVALRIRLALARERTATRGWTVPVEVRATGVGRRPEEVEAAL